MRKWILAGLLILALVLSFVAGMVTVLRVERDMGPPGCLEPQVPWNGCANCEARWGEFLCWLSGC